jgi:RHH-type proline utilization regulon transcriptional repressor/proline dehydrogenase/delta 1-pyrroline-5-carboxylate dehydrogenase
MSDSAGQYSAELLDEVDHLVRSWLKEAATKRADPAAKRLAAVLKDPAGLAFTLGFVDRVIRPEDDRIAAQSFRELARDVPRFLPVYLRWAVRLGAMAAMLAPAAVIQIVRRAFRGMVGNLLLDATDARLTKSIGRLRRSGVSLNINLLGEAVLGAAEAGRRRQGTQVLLARPDVDYVSIKVSATVAPHSAWAFEESVEHIEASLLPLYQLAAGSRTPKFINLDMEEYRDLDLTMAVFTRMLDRPEFLTLEAGIVLQAYLPDALGAMIRLQKWAAARRACGGAAIKVRLVKGANLPMEQVEASLHGWPATTWASKQETDTNYKRVLNYALDPERAANVRLGVAGHNLFDIAYALVLADRRGVRDRVEFEMLLGMASAQAEVIREHVGGLLLYVPVVRPRDFNSAIAYLVRRLEEGASSENFMSAVFDLSESAELYEREKGRFAASLRAVDEIVPPPNRHQDRSGGTVVASGPFGNVSDTDPSLPANRAWGRAIIGRVADSETGLDLVATHTVTSSEDLDALVGSAVEAGARWGERSGAERAAILRRAAQSLEAHRAALLEVMASECGKTLDQGDPEVSEAIDFATYYADLAESLDRVDGAAHVPTCLTVVTPPWNFPVAIPAGGVTAALAAGSAVIIKPATQARRCGSVMVQALWDAGVPREVLQLVHLDEGDLGQQLIADPRVDRLILTGAFETAQLFRDFRPDLPLLAETSGKNAIVVTPHADLDLAVKDLAYSAFGHAGQKCSAASLGILVGSVATSQRFRDQLIDAVASLVVDYPTNPEAEMGPVIEPVAGKLRDALTHLGDGESWLVEPRPLDETGRLWSPGVKVGVRPGSAYHLTEYFGPVLGLMAARDLDEAIAWQNQVDYGLTGGIHSLDPREVGQWIETVEVGNAYVNRTTVGAIVRRQPFGGWKKSAVGAGTKAGGPNYLIGLSDWRPEPAKLRAEVESAAARVLREARALQDVDLAFLERSLASDAAAWADEFGIARDVSGLTAEYNVLRYRPMPVTIRVEDGAVGEVLRVVAAGLRAGAPVTVSSAEEFAPGVDAVLGDLGIHAVVEDRAMWVRRLATDPPVRVRLLGGSRAQFAEDSCGRVDVALYDHPVVEAGRIEMLPFLREQAVAITAHRFGSPSAAAAEMRAACG